MRRIVNENPSESEIDPTQVKDSMARRFLSEDGATCGEMNVSELEVTWGGEKFSPINFHFFDVGPITVRIKPEPHEKVNEAYRRAYELINRYGQLQFQNKLKDYLERIKLVAAAVGSAKVK